MSDKSPKAQRRRKTPAERMENLIRLVMLMQSGSPYSINELAETLCVTRRTVFRYMKILYNVGFPLEYSEKHRAHRVASIYSGAHPQLTADELTALMLTLSTSRALPSKKLNTLVQLAVAKLTSRLTGDARESIANLRAACARPLSPSGSNEGMTTHFEKLTQAVTESRAIRITFRNGQEVASTKLLPESLIYRRDTWVVYGRSSLHRRAREFEVSSILTAELLDEKLSRRQEGN